LGKPSHGQLGAPLQLHRRLHRLDALVSRSDGLRERGLEALIGRDLLRVLLIASSVAMPSALSTRAVRGRNQSSPG